MYSQKLHPGAAFPDIEVTSLSGDTTMLSQRQNSNHWKMVIVYRGKHCPLCTKYLNVIEKYVGELTELDIEMIAVSADSKSQLDAHLTKLDISFPIAYGLTEKHMRELGLYISNPRSDKETDHNFAEPAIFVINEHGNIQVVDISNNPFARPDFAELVSGIRWIKNPENNYPIRGTVKY